MSVVHVQALSAPVYAQPRRVEVAYRLEAVSGPGHRVTAVGGDGDVLLSIWDISLDGARAEATRSAKKLERIAERHPAGVPFERRRAQ